MIFYGITKKASFDVMENEDNLRKLKYVYEVRNVTPGRIYHIFFLISHILKFQAKAKNLLPTTISSWKYVLDTCKETDQMEMRRRRSISSLPPTFTLLNEGEFSTLRRKCKHWLGNAVLRPIEEKRTLFKTYMQHLIALTLVSIPPPRTQVFCLMEEKHLVWSDKLQSYEIRFDGISPPLKNGKAIYLVLPRDLAIYYKVEHCLCAKPMNDF
jgi:hypothetical protein